MIDQSFEQRIAAALAAYADRAPTEVDPMAMTRLAAARWRRIGPVWVESGASRALAFAVILMALLVTIVAGALIAGGARPSLDDSLTRRGFVEPFLGLPPEGASPSIPETGELVFSFNGRVYAIGLDVHVMWVYADGRLIWKRNLDNRKAEGRLGFGATEPTRAVIEQRLTPEGVELLRSEVTTTARVVGRSVGDNEPWPGGPGVLWGRLLIGGADPLLAATWSDVQLPARLVDPASWLPGSAWDDQRIGGYVPTRYAVCLDPPNGLARVPGTARDLILANATNPGGIWNWEPDSECYLVPTEAARAIAATLEEAGIQLDEVSSGLASFGRRVFIFPVTPDGEPMCVTCG